MRRKLIGRNLLFGTMALQIDLISREALVDGLRAWVGQVHNPLADILVNQGVLTAEDRAMLDPLVDRHVEQSGGDPSRSLQRLSSSVSIPWTQEWILTADREIQESVTGFLADQTRPPVDRSVTESLLPFDPDRANGSERSPIGRSTPGGRFRILELHAQGGLGLVYLAQDRELGRQVALKEIQPDRANEPSSRSRFILEAEINGNLEHPNIVPIYGLGKHSDGRPFYAMRFIQGCSLKEEITDFHRELAKLDRAGYNLKLRQLLGRFLDVCDAIAYAHSRGVLHRDLKPGNIMLGQYGETLIIDWGLAKATDSLASASPLKDSLVPSSGSTVAPTLAGQALGTPGYMSPEQASGKLDDLGPATDIYSLGATLYAILVGEAPIRSGSVRQMVAQVQEGMIVPARQKVPRTPAALEAICLKAMALDPSTRYPSAEAFAQDIQRFLADESVSARPDPPLIRLARWLRQHRTIAATAASAILVGSVGLALTLTLVSLKNAELSRTNESLRLANEATGRAKAEVTSKNAELSRTNQELVEAEAEAEARLDLAMNSIREYFDGVSKSAIRGGELPEQLRDRLLEKPQQFYEQLSTELEAKETPTVREQSLLAESQERLSALLFVIGRIPQAEIQLQKAIGVYRELVSRSPDHYQTQLGLSTCLISLAVMTERQGEYQQSLKLFSEAGQISKSLISRHPEKSLPSERLLTSLLGQGRSLDLSGQKSRAIEVYSQAVTLGDDLMTDDPENLETLNLLVVGLSNLGNLYRVTGQISRAIEVLERGVTLAEVLIDADPEDPRYQSRLAGCLSNLAINRAITGELPKAIVMFERSVETLETLITLQPEVPFYRTRLVAVLGNLGYAYKLTQQQSKAIAIQRRAIEILEDQVERMPQVVPNRTELTRAYTNLSGMLTEAGQTEEAIEVIRRSLSRLEGLAELEPDLPDHRSILSTTLGNLASTLVKQEKNHEALPVFQRAIVATRPLIQQQPEILQHRVGLANQLANYANALLQVDRPREAAQPIAESIEILTGLVSKDPEIREYQISLGTSYQLGFRISLRSGQMDRALQIASERIALWKREPEQLIEAAADLTLLLHAHDELVVDHEAVAAMIIETIDQAIDAGLTDVELLVQEPRFDQIRDRDDFRKLLGSIYDHQFPKNVFQKD